MARRPRQGVWLSRDPADGIEGVAPASLDAAVRGVGIPGKSALEQLGILEDAGVDPARVVIGHLGNLVDSAVQVHTAICRRAAFVGFDREGGPGDAPFPAFVPKIKRPG